MNLYRCVFKGNENYDSALDFLTPYDTMITIFPDGVENAPSDLSPYQRQIDNVLGDADPRDLIIFNGPSWLIALVGHRWYSDEERKHHNVLVFDKELGKYKRLTLGAIDDY